MLPLFVGLDYGVGSFSKVNSWVAVMENGCTNKKVLEGFINSNEFDNLCKDLGIETGSYKSDEIADQNVKIAAFVARLYRIVLERRYDREGLDNWVRSLVPRPETVLCRRSGRVHQIPVKIQSRQRLCCGRHILLGLLSMHPILLHLVHG